MTTGAFIALHQDVVSAGLGNKVVFIEMTVDPRRDTPARLAAYSSRFGANWTLLTGSATNLAKIWKQLGVWYQVVPEGKPAQIDWWTGKPLTYDVDHSDGYFLIAPNGNERFGTSAMANLHGKLSPKLKTLLDAQGFTNLDHAQGPTWTVSSALSSIGWLVGKNIPAVATT